MFTYEEVIAIEKHIKEMKERYPENSDILNDILQHIITKFSEGGKDVLCK